MFLYWVLNYLFTRPIFDKSPAPVAPHIFKILIHHWDSPHFNFSLLQHSMKPIGHFDMSCSLQLRFEFRLVLHEIAIDGEYVLLFFYNIFYIYMFCHVGDIFFRFYVFGYAYNYSEKKWKWKSMKYVYILRILFL